MLDFGLWAMEAFESRRDMYMAEAQSNRLAKQWAPAPAWTCRLCLRLGQWLTLIGGALERRAESRMQGGRGQPVHSLLRLGQDTLPKDQPASTMH